MGVKLDRVILKAFQLVREYNPFSRPGYVPPMNFVEKRLFLESYHAPCGIRSAMDGTTFDVPPEDIALIFRGRKSHI